MSEDLTPRPPSLLGKGETDAGDGERASRLKGPSPRHSHSSADSRDAPARHPSPRAQSARGERLGVGPLRRPLTDVQPGQKLGVRGRWRVFRERWPYLPLHWKIGIIGLTLISVFETIRTGINLLQGEYF